MDDQPSTAHGDGPPAAVLGTDGILVHIGLPKTATTSLQSCLAASRTLLADHGVLYPGSKGEHVVASFAPLEWFATPRIEVEARQEWARMTKEIAAHPGRVVYSAENLCVADDDAVRRVVDGLGRERVRVVVTVRAWHLLLPSFWQHEVRAGLSTPFDVWAATTAEGPDAPDGSSSFWLIYNLASVVERWSEVVGADRLTVVVVDPARPHGVFADVEALIGLPSGLLDPARGDRTNRSFTAAEAEVIRRLNERLADVDFKHNDHLNGRFVRPAAIRNLIEGRSPGPDELRMEVPHEVMERLRPVADEAVRRLRDSGVSIVGDPAALMPPDTGHLETGPADTAPPRTVPLEAAVLLIERLLPPVGAPVPRERDDPAPSAASVPSAATPATTSPPSRTRRLLRRVVPVRVRRTLLSVSRRR